MNSENTLDLRLKFNTTTQRIEVSVISEGDPGPTLESILRFTKHVDADPLADLMVDTEKADPETMKTNTRLRAMWEKTTCDIIK